MKNNYSVYQHVTPDGMYYFGQTQNVERRWKNNGAEYKGTALQPYIEKFGWNNIQHIVLFKDQTRENALWIEDFLITTAQEDGVCINQRRSGLISKEEGYYQQMCKKYHEENKDNIHERHKQYYKQNKDKIIQHQREYQKQNRDKIREYNREYIRQSRQRNERISKAMPNGKRSKPVLQLSLSGDLIREWPSTAECGRNGFSQSSVSLCCHGKQKTHKGFLWMFADDYKEKQLKEVQTTLF